MEEAIGGSVGEGDVVEVFADGTGHSVNKGVGDQDGAGLEQVLVGSEVGACLGGTCGQEDRHEEQASERTHVDSKIIMS